MNRSKSIQSNMDTINHTISKSPSLDSFLNIKETVKIEFEGDGNLGIFFDKNKDNKIEVVGIKKLTLADEYYQLKVGMIVNKVNDYKYDDFLYENYMKLIGLLWNKNHKLTIEFIEPELNDNDIYVFLKSIDCEQHYSLFQDLGAKTKDDLSFVEDGDLLHIDKTDRTKIMKSIKRVESDVFDFDD